MVTAITGGTLVDVVGGRAVEDAVVLVEHGRVREAGPAAGLRVPPDATVIDARGTWLIPGLTDMHVHTSVYQYRHTDLYLRHGVTTVRDVGGDVTLLRLLRDDIDAGRAAGPRLFFTGNIADGNPPVWRTSFTMLVDAPERADSFVDFLADQGACAIKIYNLLSEPTVARIIETARRRGLPVIGHVPRCMTMTRAVEMGVEGLEHIRITAREVLPAAEADAIDYQPFSIREPALWERLDLDGEAMNRLVSLLAAEPVYLDPTLLIDEAVFVLGLDSMKRHPNNALLPPEEFARLAAVPDMPIFDVPEDRKAAAVAMFRKRQQFVGKCGRAGVRILAGTDAFGLGTLVSGWALHRELELLCGSGLSPLEALRAATLTAAQALRQEEHLGAIAPGRFADIVLLEANPLDDIRHTRRIAAVIKGGEVVFSSESMPHPA